MREPANIKLLPSKFLLNFPINSNVMPEYNIYPDQITKVHIGRAEIKGYECPKPCYVINGYIAQGDRITMYFTCPYGEKGDDCKYLSDFLRGEDHTALVKTKRGDKRQIINDLTEAVLSDDKDNVTLPFEINIVDDDFTPKNLGDFFKGVIGCETQVHSIEGKGRKFVLELTKINEFVAEGRFKKWIDRHFSSK